MAIRRATSRYSPLVGSTRNICSDCFLPVVFFLLVLPRVFKMHGGFRKRFWLSLNETVLVRQVPRGARAFTASAARLPLLCLASPLGMEGRERRLPPAGRFASRARLGPWPETCAAGAGSDRCGGLALRVRIAPCLSRSSSPSASRGAARIPAVPGSLSCLSAADSQPELTALSRCGGKERLL